MQYHRTAKTVILSLFFCCIVFASNTSYSLDISEVPLVIKQAVKPNIIIALDDSGSMDSEVLMPTNDGALWWHTGDKSFFGRDADDANTNTILNFNKVGTASDTWKKYVYLFPNGLGSSSGLRVYGDASNDHYAIPPLPQYAYTRSPEYNKAYFNPRETYTPWVGYGSTTFGNATPSAAPSDPVRGTSTLNLTVVRESADTNHTFRMHSGMVIPAGVYCKIGGASWGTTAVNTEITSTLNVGIRYFPATFYLPEGATLPGDYGYTGTTFNGLAPDGITTLHGYEIKPANFASTGQYEAAIQNFANWYTYYRKRHAATRAGIGEAFSEMTNIRATSFLINNRVNVGMLDFGVPAEKNSFFSTVYSLIGSGGTPNKEAVKHMGNQFMRMGSDAPITESCQQNFGILFTDGFSNTWWSAGVGNADENKGAPFADDVSNTMADIAMHFYSTHLRNDMATGQVPVPAQCRAPNPHLSLDCNKDLHMVLFGVTLGASGQVFGVDTAATEDPYTNPPIWPTYDLLNQSRHPSAVDDLWHAAINSRGALLNANTPKDISGMLKSVLADIALRTSSASAITSNTTRLDTDTLIYQAQFNSEDWSGHLLAYSLNVDGSVNELKWNAANRIPTHSGRNIFTYAPGSPGSGIPFTWTGLLANQKNYLYTSSETETQGQTRLAYLRGDQAYEQKNGGQYRNRNYLLGDIINSDPLLVRKSDYGYHVLPSTEGSTYETFRASVAGRPPMIYIGANDGMLHAFDATIDQTTSGVELFAYVPNSLLPRLIDLTDPNYSHKYYVDGSPRAGDAYLNSLWKTVLVGSTGAGGKSIFALDITDPTGFSAEKVLWEFTNNELGYTMGQPTIVRLGDGNWYAAFGNGYGSNSQKAQLFLVNLATGTSPIIIDTKAGSEINPNGLSTPIPVDINNDRITDYIYAGDLQGNLWKFNVSHSNASQWNVAFTSGQNKYPLFTARDESGNVQPITTRPIVGSHPTAGYMVYFGTGKFFEVGDNDVDGISNHQSFYGIYDNNSTRITATDRSVLEEQEIIYEGNVFNRTIRVTSDYPVNYSDTSDPTNNPVRRGWYMDLMQPDGTLQGERVVSQALLRQGRIIFASLIPSEDPCDFGGSSWLMELDALTGGRLAYSAFDFNGDRRFSEADFVTVTIDGVEITVPVSGMKLDVGMVKTPAVISAGEVEYKFFSGSTGDIEVVTEQAGGDSGTGRQSWRQLQ